MYKVKQKDTNRKILPLCLLAIVPLLVMGHRYSTGLGGYVWFGGDEQVDFFYYYKMWATVIIAAIMLVMLVVHIWTGKKLVKFTKKEYIQFIPLAGYLVLSLISTMISKYSTFGYLGGYEQFECVWAVIGYGIIAFYAFCFVTNETASVYVMRAVAACAGVVGLIGAFQAAGLDFFKTGLMTKILSSSVNSEISFSFEANRTYSTLYNPNYVGVFCVLLVPVMLSMVLDARKVWEKVVYGIVTLLLLVSLAGCQSKTGILVLAGLLVVLAGLLVVMAVFGRKMIFSKRKLAIPLMATMAVVLLGGVIWRGDWFVQALKEAFRIEKTETPGWDCIKTQEDKVSLCYNGQWICLSLNPYAYDLSSLLVATDENGEFLTVESVEEGKVNVYSADQSVVMPVQCGYITEEDLGFVVDYGIQAVFVYKDGEFLYYAGDDKMESIDTSQIERAAFLEGYERLFSGRGYIWEMTLPLLKDRIFLGSGQDSFTVIYPNHDLAGKYKYGYSSQIITKPHNIYLQMACQDGVIAMLLCVFVWIYYLIRAFRNQWKADERPIASLGIMIGVLGYVLMGFLNDSTIAVAPIFWLLLGLGIRQNYEMERAKKEEVKEA
ncbi:MAG: O-antigen ligase family protein [Lachnospiraceae bacterium]